VSGHIASRRRKSSGPEPCPASLAAKAAMRFGAPREDVRVNGANRNAVPDHSPGSRSAPREAMPAIGSQPWKGCIPVRRRAGTAGGMKPFQGVSDHGWSHDPGCAARPLGQSRTDGVLPAPIGAKGCSHGWRSPQATGTRGSDAIRRGPPRQGRRINPPDRPIRRQLPPKECRTRGPLRPYRGGRRNRRISFPRV